MNFVFVAESEGILFGSVTYIVMNKNYDQKFYSIKIHIILLQISD